MAFLRPHVVDGTGASGMLWRLLESRRCFAPAAGGRPDRPRRFFDSFLPQGFWRLLFSVLKTLSEENLKTQTYNS